MIRIRTLMLVFLVFAIQFLLAIMPDSPAAAAVKSTTTAVKEPGKQAPLAEPLVRKAWRILPKDADTADGTQIDTNDVDTARKTKRYDTSKNNVWLGQAFRVKIDNLPAFLQALCEKGASSKTNCKQKNISLFLNGMEFKGINPRLIDDHHSAIEFVLPRREALPTYIDDAQQKSVWTNLFGFQNRLTLTPRIVSVSVGSEGGNPLRSRAKLQLEVIHPDIWTFFYICILLIMISLYRYAGKRGAFSDRGVIENEKATPALSLARVQMGFWFFLVVGGFLFIWMVIGELPAIPASVLGLIGIASGTALGAAVIDSNKRASAGSVVAEQIARQNKIQTLTEEKEAKDNSLKTLDQDSIDLKKRLPSEPNLLERIDRKKQDQDKLTQEIAALDSNIKELKKKHEESENLVAAAQRNKGAVQAHNLVADLLNDANGISFHRLQMLIWTLVLGIIFVQQVITNLSLPDFDASLLALMGISSGTYLGFKLPEQQPVPNENE